MDFRFADKLIKLRRNKGYTLEEAANLLGVNKETLISWESGEIMPDDSHLRKISIVYDCDINDLKQEDKHKRMKPNNENSKKNRFIIWATTSLTSLCCVIAFLWLGFGYDWWHPAWLVFFLIPIISSIGTCIVKRNFKYFCYPILMVAIYLFLGCCYNLWHPLWIIFLTVPAYYVIAKGVNILLDKDVNED